ncbi:hypothetical protein LOH54_02135 [Sulfurimonas sp. HSL-3221]|uniref:hypothetical protein n=1 Tax=Thiomicrolovo sulfuroxydans TaxID=2894755 RepID=UPI001E4CAAB6|nr:hypothetical protein [Sulfurimonas sp. HSL-3221]UFS62934.1 hypothetical protein LOH54_02135 [Sulfurimonas sp. HSL-3221]
MRGLILALFPLLLLLGCGESNSRQQPYLMGQNPKGPYATPQQLRERSEKIETAKIKADADKEIALINKARDIEVQKLISETDVAKAGITKEVAMEEAQTKKIAIEKEHEEATYFVWLIGAALLLLFWFLFYYTGKNRKERLKIHEDELLYKLRIQEQEMKMKMAEKMLDSITSGKLSPEQENRLIDTLEHTTTKLIEQKR